MLKVILVDDEAIIKQGLKDQINWSGLGYIVSGEAADGREALELIRSDPPDLVISDIQMPFKAGLDLMEEARKEYPRIQFLFISGHDEFDYVQKALKLGATDYILKPIDPVYLESRLTDIAESMQDADRNAAAVELSRRAEIRQLLQTAVFNHPLDDAVLNKEATRIGFDSNFSFFQIVSFQIDDYFQHAGEDSDEEIESLHRGFYDIARDFAGKQIYQITENIREYDVCLVADSQNGIDNLVESLLGDLAETKETRDFTVTIGIGNAVGRLANLRDCFGQAREARELKFLKGGDAVYTFAQVLEIRDKSESADVLARIIDDIASGIQNGAPDTIEVEIKNLSSGLGAITDPRGGLSWISSQILLRATRTLEELGYSMEEVIDDPLREWAELNKLPTADLVLEGLETLLVSIARYIARRRDTRSSQILDQALNYIKEHFADNRMSLDSAAAEACMSPCYFSVLFKQETGENFQRYLANLRIAKAKDLILYTDKKSYEIAPEVGYENASYFSTMFKKATGMSPSEYRKQFS